MHIFSLFFILFYFNCERFINNISRQALKNSESVRLELAGSCNKSSLLVKYIFSSPLPLPPPPLQFAFLLPTGIKYFIGAGVEAIER